MAAKGTSAASGSMAGAIENYIIKIPLHRAGRLTSKAPSPTLYLPQCGKSVSLCQSISLLHSCPSHSHPHSPCTSPSFLTSPQLLLPFKNFKWKTLSASCSSVYGCVCVCDRRCTLVAVLLFRFMTVPAVLSNAFLAAKWSFKLLTNATGNLT